MADARLVKLVGLARAQDIVLGGQDLDAEEAWKHGLVNKVVPHEKLVDQAKERLRFILERAPQATVSASGCAPLGQR